MVARSDHQHIVGLGNGFKRRRVNAIILFRIRRPFIPPHAGAEGQALCYSPFIVDVPGKMVLAEGLALAAAGLGAGLAAALGLARFLKSQLYAVGAYDPITFIISMAVLLGVAIVACYLPARRAMKVDPMVALRCE